MHLSTLYGLPVLGEATTPADLVALMRAARHEQQAAAEHGYTMQDRFRPTHRFRPAPRRRRTGGKRWARS